MLWPGMSQTIDRETVNLLTTNKYKGTMYYNNASGKFIYFQISQY